jgi:type VII secretion protein EccB
VPTLNQKDQAQAYAFLLRRQHAALMHDEPDSPDLPMRRLTVAMFASVMVAVLAVAAAGVYGLLRPGGSTAWKSGQSLILEKDTGTRYVYAHGVLHPVLNYASARLVLGQASPGIVSVSAASLRGVQRGLPIGIPGAPDELPAPGSITSGPWSVCSLPATSASGSVSPLVRLTVGAAPGGESPLPAGQAFLVSGTDGTVYLVWHDHRLRVPDGNPALTALGYASASQLTVGDAWLSALPQGPDLAAPPLPNAGAGGPGVAGQPAQVGQVFATGSGTGAQYFVELADGLAPVSYVQAELLLEQPGLRSLYPSGQPVPFPVTGVAAAASRSATMLTTDGLPAIPPPLVPTGGGQVGVCETYPPGGTSLPSLSTISVPATGAGSGGTAPASGTVAGPGTAGVPALAVADQVQVPPGGGVVARSVPAPGATGTLYVVTDEGVKYPLTDPSVLTPLGLGGVSPVMLPSALLALLPTGPTLDVQAAARTASP